MKNRFGYEYDFEAMEEISEQELYELYDEMLDEFGCVAILNLKYNTSTTLKRVDPIAYRCGFADWFDEEVTEERFIEGEDGKVYVL